MGSPWKALSDDNRRRILLLLKERDMITPTEIAGHFDFTLPGVSINLRILKEAGLITKKKEGKKMYSLNRKTTSDMVRFFDDMHDYELESLKEYAENKEKKERRK
jgi:DNA-binding transcriptional ArsR family regulator